MILSLPATDLESLFYGVLESFTEKFLKSQSARHFFETVDKLPKIGTLTKQMADQPL